MIACKLAWQRSADWILKNRRSKCGVDEYGYGAGEFCHFGDVCHLQGRVGRGFQHNEARGGADVVSQGVYTCPGNIELEKATV